MRRVWPARSWPLTWAGWAIPACSMSRARLLTSQRKGGSSPHRLLCMRRASPTPNESGRALPNPARLSDEALDENIMAFHRSEGRAEARIQAENRGQQAARKLVRGGIRARSAGLNFRGMILAEREDVFNAMARQCDREAVREEHVYNFLRMNLSRYVRPRPLGQLFGGREPNHDGFPYWHEDLE